MRDPLEQLDRSHRRHDEELAALAEAVARGDRARIGDGLDFLERSTPRHFADEEEGLFPRLVARAPEAAEAVARLVAEHREHERLCAEMFAAFDRRERSRFEEAFAALSALYRRHVAEEDRLFGEVAARLGVEDREAIAAGMDARRGRG